jgi:lysozyme
MKLLPSSNTIKGGSIVKVDKFLPTKKLDIAQKSSNILNKNNPNKILEIEKKVINIDNLFKDLLSFKKNENKKRRKTKEVDRFRKREEDLEKKKPKEEKGKNIIPMKPKLGIFGWLTNFITNVVLGFIFVRLIDHLPKLIGLIPIINGVMDGIIDWGGKLLDGLVTFIDWGYSAYDNTVKVFEKFGGKDASKKFEDFMGKFKDVINYSLIAGMLFSDLAMSGGGDEGSGGILDTVTDLLGNKGAKGAKAAKGATAAKGAGVGAAGASAIVAGAGLLASALGEGAFQLKKIGNKKVESAKKELDSEKNLLMKPIRWVGYQQARFTNFSLGTLGVLLDIVGTPFRYAIELIRYPFLSEEDKEKQAKNLAKFDSRIREQVREGLNALTFGMAFKEKGFFGNIFGNKGAQSEMISKMAGGGLTRGGQYKSETPTRQIKSKKVKRGIALKPAKLKQGNVTGGIEPLQKVFPEPKDIKSPQGTLSQKKDETMNSYGFLSHSYYRFASVPFIGPLLAMPLKVMLGDSIDSGYYTSIGQGFESLLGKAYNEGAFSDDFDLEGIDVEKIVSKSVEELTTREMSKIRTDLMQQLMLEKLKITPGKPSHDCPCPEPGGDSGGSSAYYGTPEQKALLDAIAFAEGTSGPNGYRTMYGHDLFNAPPWRHPDTVVTKGYSSTAAGRYQFLTPTWNRAASALGLSDFSPINQDKAAWWLVDKIRGVSLNMLKSEGLSANVAAKLAPEWASLPTLAGRSFYGQPVKALSSIQAVYRSSLSGSGGTAPVNTHISPSSPAGSVSDCVCDGDNIPDSDGINSPTNPEALGPVGKNGKIYLHWNAAANNNPYGYQRKYHSIFTEDGKKYQGTPYTQFNTPEGHTAYRNSLGVGLAVAGMGGKGVDINNYGSQVPSMRQYEAMAQEASNLAKAWGWSSSMVNVRNVATHAEVGSMKDGVRNSPALWSQGAKSDPDNHGPQAWGGDGSRWDLFKLRQGDPAGSGGDKIRNMIKQKMGSAGKFSGGSVNEGLTKVHPGEFVIDKDSVDSFGIGFMEVINEVENKTQLKSANQILIQMLKEIVPEYSENAPDEIIYNYIPGPSPNINIAQKTTYIIQGSSGKSYGNPAMDLLSVG